MGILKELGEEILAAVYPENLYCMACNDLLDGQGTVTASQWGLCDRCLAKLFSDENLKGTLGKDCEGRSYSQVLACTVYGGLSKEIIGKFKNKNMPWLGKNIGALMAERFLEEQRERNRYDLSDLVTFVPMHPAKKRIRGYDQAQLLAEQVGRSLKIPCVDCLERTRKTMAMKNMSEEQRNQNVAGAFQLRESGGNCTAERGGLLRGKRVILVDDIVTTGSTAEACASILKQAGAKEVTVLAFAAAAHQNVK
ncbi:MAG: ComF family protein [Firmicutes bacterium]|nr:ComF family protein [Bacillota bacterium]